MIVESLISDVLNVIRISTAIIMTFSGMSRKILLDRRVIWSVPPKAGLDTPDTCRTLDLEVRLGL